MNSKQRRQQRRQFPYVVIVKARAGEAYFHHDYRVDEGRDWCCSKLKKDSWRFSEAWDHAEFKFTDQKSATYFALKWA